MKCEKCNEREASVFFEQTVNGETTSLHLCHECAAKLQGTSPFQSTPFQFGTSLLENLFGHTQATRTAGKTCPHCGANFAEIRREGKVCCPGCYAAFRAELEPTIRSLHGHVEHSGRAPAGQSAVREKQNKLSTLKKALQEAIAAEQYEQAAQLRDEIRNLEKEGN